MTKNAKCCLCVLVLLIGLNLVGCGGGVIGLEAEKKPIMKETVLGNYGSKLTVKLPIELKEETMALPEYSNNAIDKHIFFTGSNKFMVVSIINGLYKKQIDRKNWTPNLEGAAEGSIESVSQSKGVKNFSSTKQYISVSGIPAIIVTMRYINSKSVPVEQKGFILMDNFVGWFVNITCKQDDTASQEMVQKILNSISISK